MRDGKISDAVVWAGALWAASAVIMAAGWTAAALGYWRPGLMISQLALMVAAAAAVAHVRIYAVRISVIIRRLHGVEVVDHDPGDRSRV